MAQSTGANEMLGNDGFGSVHGKLLERRMFKK
jgi:hypothetical protein